MSDPIVLKINQISKQFDRTLAPVLDQISLELREGEILGLLGPSGCGKTTLLRLIAGFESLNLGTIELSGDVIATPDHSVVPEKRNIGMVFQDYALFPHLTIAQNVAFGLQKTSRKRFSPVQIQALMQESIDRVGLSGLESRYPHELSGGQQQRVALARALAPHPAMILLDEPLSNLDIQVRLRLRQEIRSILKNAGTSAIFVTHDQEEALSMCDRIAVMNRGHLEQVGTPESIYQMPSSRFVAEFVTQANFIEATFVSGLWQTDIGEFPAIEHLANPDAKSKLDLMIRQEDIQIKLDDRSPIVIGDRYFLGREYCYELLLPSGQKLLAHCPVSEQYAIGVTVAIVVKPGNIRII
jgi:iron(III) transport system ATP-binding protein